MDDKVASSIFRLFPLPSFGLNLMGLLEHLSGTVEEALVVSEAGTPVIRH